MVDVLRLTRELIDIPSVTGEEFQIGTSLGDLLVRLGYHVELQDISPERSNIIATTQAKPRVVLSTHMDTVPPFIASSEDDEFIYGRGACDAKGIIAAQIAAAERLRGDGIDEIGLLFTVDEEVTSVGAKIANEHPIAESCEFLINGEPTDNRLAIGTKGSVQATISAQGRAAHSAYPEQGESAIEKLLDALARIRKIPMPADAALGPSTLNIGVIGGGRAPNVIPDDARAEIFYRLVDSGESLQAATIDAVNGLAEAKQVLIIPAIHLGSMEGFETAVMSYTTDIPAFNGAWGKPYLIGPGSIHVAHTNEERIPKTEITEAIQIYEKLVRRLIQ